MIDFSGAWKMDIPKGYEGIYGLDVPCVINLIDSPKLEYTGGSQESPDRHSVHVKGIRYASHTGNPIAHVFEYLKNSQLLHMVRQDNLMIYRFPVNFMIVLFPVFPRNEEIYYAYWFSGEVKDGENFMALRLACSGRMRKEMRDSK